jgi:NAD(P)-dependent dehydrogenase (short-subunit alcohol dehydrogenase family)
MIKSSGGDAIGFGADISSSQDVQRMFANVLEHYGTVDKAESGHVAAAQLASIFSIPLRRPGSSEITIECEMGALD